MKKKLVALLLCVVSIVALSCGTIIVHADTSVNIDTEQLEQYSAELNQTLADNGTTAGEQLDIFYNELEELINETTDSEQKSKYSTMKNMVAELKNRDINLCSSSDLLPPTATGTTRSVMLGFAELATAVLKLMKLDLTAELLLKSFVISENSTQPYIPIYGYKVKQSQEFKKIANGNNISDSAKFNNRSNKIEEDLYFSIHGFNYFKPSASSKTVIITDEYDFNSNRNANIESGFPKWSLPIISGMCFLHDNNIVTYYKIEITEALSSSIEFNDTYGYKEKIVNVGANELMDFEATSYHSGRSLIQTFGTSNTELYVLDSDGKTLASAKGNGYNGNSLISYKFSSGKKYVIRIKHTDKSTSGYIKLGIFRDARNVNSFSDIGAQKLYTNTYTATAAAGNMYMAQIVPLTANDYKITFADNIRFNAYLIDIDSTESYTWLYNQVANSNGQNSFDYSTFAAVGPGFITIPDYGEGGVPSSHITVKKSLIMGNRYLLVVCGDPAYSSGVKINFKIETA